MAILPNVHEENIHKLCQIDTSKTRSEKSLSGLLEFEQCAGQTMLQTMLLWEYTITYSSRGSVASWINECTWPSMLSAGPTLS
jgi:hypothetical protein